MRTRDPRRLLARRRRAGARVRLLGSERFEGGLTADGERGVTTVQRAEVALPRSELERMWTPAHLERLARTYWRFLTRCSLGLLRVEYAPHARAVVLLARPLVLLTFSAPEYETAPGRGTVTWNIDRGLLVAPAGRGRGCLRLTVERRPERGEDGLAVVALSSAVLDFHPLIRGWGRFATIGRGLYRLTQLQLHIVVTNGFLRSLANLDLAPSAVGALADDAPLAATTQPASTIPAAPAASPGPSERPA